MKPTQEHPETEDAGLDNAPTGTKKPYKKPQLINLGSLRDVTMKLASGAADGGKPGRSGTKRGGNFDGEDCFF
jgi:hypothetical protein